MILTLFLGLGLKFGCIIEDFDNGKIFYCYKKPIYVVLKNGKKINLEKE